MRGEEGNWLEVGELVAMEGDATKVATCLFVFISVLRSCNVESDHRFLIFEGWSHFSLPWLPQAAPKKMCTSACQVAGGGGWVAGNLLREEIDEYSFQIFT